MGLAWHTFLSHPTTGVGVVGLGRVFVDHDFGPTIMDRPLHPHNLLLYLLASSGIVGCLAWAIIFMGLFVAAGGEGRRALAPAFSALMILNLSDLSFFFSGVFFAFWLIAATVLAGSMRSTVK